MFYLPSDLSRHEPQGAPVAARLWRVGRRDLDWVLDYIRRQREHHARGRNEARVEACDLPDSPDDVGASPAEAG
jgi:hypothetical protein